MADKEKYPMKTSSLIAALMLGAAFASAPAVAKTSITKGKQVCEAAAKAQTPAPKTVRTDRDATRVSDTSLVYTLRVKNADDTSAKLACTVDRETDAPVLAPAP
jgi:hypothetical protein